MIGAMLAALLVGTPALANYVAKLSFDRQIVASDAFVIVRATGDEKPCPGDSYWSEMCTTVEVLHTFKGDPGRNFQLLVKGASSEEDPDCCTAGAIYAVAVQRSLIGAYVSVNGRWGVTELPGPWARSYPAAVQPPWPDGRRRLSFDQNVVAADHVVIAVATGEAGPCPGESVATDEMCASLRVIKSFKGEAPKTFSMRVSSGVFDFETRATTIERHGCCESGQIYFLALAGSFGGAFFPVNGADSVQRLFAPAP